MYPDFTWMFWLCCFLWTNMGYIWIHHTFMMWVNMFMTWICLGCIGHMSGWEITKIFQKATWLIGRGHFFFGAWYHRYPIFIHIHMDIRYMMYPYLSHISLVIFTRKKVTVSRNWNYQTLHNTAALLTFIFVVNLNMELNTGLKLGEAQRSGSVLSISQRCGFNKNHNPCPLHVR